MRIAPAADAEVIAPVPQTTIERPSTAMPVHAETPIADVVARQYFAKPMHAVFRHEELAAYRAVAIDVQQPVLDLGCGKGEFGAAFARLAGLSSIDVGSDLTPQYVGLARRSGLYGLVMRADATRLPLDDASIGFVVCNGVLCCIDPGAEQAMREIARVLRPGGQAIVTVPTPEFTEVLAPTRWLRQVGLARLADAYASRSNLRHGHRRLTTLDGWCAELTRAGLHVEDRVSFFTGSAATWWSVLAMRPFQLLAALRYAPRGVQRLAIAATRALVKRMPSTLARSPERRGYALLVVRKPL